MTHRKSTNRLRRFLQVSAAVGGIGASLVLAGGAPSAFGASRTSASPDGRIFTIAGALRWTGPFAKSRLATATAMTVTAIAAVPGGGFLVADSNDYYGYALIYRVRPDGRVSLVAGGGNNDPVNGGPATNVSLGDPEGLAPLPHGGFLIADALNDEIDRVTPNGRISVVAGAGNGGDGGPAVDASLSNPMAVALLPHGGYLIADEYDTAVRHVWPDGHISTVHISGIRGGLQDPVSVAVLPHGSFLVADQLPERVWRVGPGGHATLAAGNGNDTPSGDGGPATKAGIGYVRSVVAEPGGGFLIGSQSPDIRRVWPDGRITTEIGTHDDPFSGDGGSVSHAQLYGAPNSAPSEVVLPHGGMLIGYGNTVRMVVGSHGTPWLAAAMRPLNSYVSTRAYKVRVELTHAAALTLRLYALGGRRAIAVVRAHRRAGASNVTVKLPAQLRAGLYGIDLHATAGRQATRAEQWVYLGGHLTARTLKHIEAQTLMSGVSTDPRQSFYVDIGPCRAFSSLRVDCVVNDSDYTLFVQALFLTREGQLRSREYAYATRHHHPFRLSPKWRGRPSWWDLGAAWAPYPMQSF